jgi:hypothetical protein
VKPPSSSDNRNTSISDRRLKLQHAAVVPAPTVMLITAPAAGGVADAAAVGVAGAATGTDRPPARGFHRNGVVMAHAHLKPALSGIDRVHLCPKAWTVALPSPQHQIHPGMNHFVAEGAFRGLLRQRFQQRLRQHDLAAPSLTDSRATAIQTSGPAHAAVTPAHGTQRLPVPRKSTVEMLTVQTMKDRQQRQQRHVRVGCSDAASSCLGQSDSSLL